MVEYVQLSQRELVGQFGISRRAAVRVGALLARGVGVSAAVLELAKQGSAIERLLLSTQLLDNAERLTPQKLDDLARGVGALGERIGLAGGLKGVQVIALAEELETTTTSLARTDSASIAPFTPIAAALAAMGDEERERLFTPEEISRLKMIVLTSADTAEKIEAIRRLVLSVAGAAEKGIVLVHALADADAGVRIEAAEGLTALGLTAGIASAARSLNEGNLQQRTRAAERLSLLVEKVSEPEIGVILTVLSKAMVGEESAEVKKTLIHSFRGACKVVAAQPARAGQLVRLLVRQLEGSEDILYPPIREILGAVGSHAPAVMTDLIIEELNAIASVELRRLLFGVLAMFEVPEDRQGELASQAIADFRGSDAPEQECQGIGSMLCEWGVLAVEKLLSALPAAEDASKIYMIRLIDEIVCRRGGEAAVEDAGAAFLRLLRVSNKRVSLQVMESTLITSSELSSDLRSEIAKELLSLYGTHANPRVNDVIETDIMKLGEPALAAITEVLTEEEDTAKRAVACRAVAGIVTRSEIGQRASLARKVLDTCLKRWHDGLHIGCLAEAIGRLVAVADCGQDMVAGIAEEFKSVVLETRDPVGVLSALGELSATPGLATAVKFDIARTFFELLEATLPDLTDQIIASDTNDDDEIHCFGREVSAYVDMIPACLDGLEKVYRSCNAHVLRIKIIEFMVAKWHETSTWRTIWGPEAVGLLMEKAGRIARDSTTDEISAGQIVAALAEHIDFLPVVVELRSVFEREDSSQVAGSAAVEVARKLLGKLPKARESEMGVLLETIGVIAARTNLGTDPVAARKVRDAALRALYRGLRDGRKEAIAALARMGRCLALPQSLRNEIADRLASIG